MASVLKVNTLTGVTTAGSIVVTGEGNSTTTSLQQGLAKAWAVSVSGASPLDSFNISSVTDNSTGNYDFTISSAMANSNFVVCGMATGLNKVNGTSRASNTTTNIHVETRNQAEGLVDADAQPAILGDLA